MRRLQDKAVIVTGAGDGIGRHIAIAFAREGASVLVADIKVEGIQETVRQIEAEGGKAFGRYADVGNPEQIDGCVADCVTMYDRLDCVVNNAANQQHRLLPDIDAEYWDLVQNVNARAAVFFAKASLPHLKAQTGSSIINIASVRAFSSFPMGTAYDSSKAALMGITRTLAVELGVFGIRVNAICPGHIMSFGEEKWKAEKDEEAQRLMLAPYPMKRVGKPEEVASVAVFLASSDASFVSGHAIIVDGASTAMHPEAAMSIYANS